MSTKVYGGFEFEDPDFLAADRLVRAFRPVVHDLQLRHYARYVAVRAINMLDRTLMGGKDATGDGSVPRLSRRAGATGRDSPLMAARMELMDRASAAAGDSRRNPAVDAYFELWVIACDGRLLGIVNAAHESWSRRWMRSPGVRPLPYWNSSDRPAGITERAWGERGRLWDRALGPSGVPAHSCWTSQLNDESLVFSHDVTNRAQAMAPHLGRSIHGQRIMECATALLLRGMDKPEDAGDFLELMGTTRRRLGDEDDAQAAEALARARDILPERVTGPMLRTPMDDIRKEMQSPASPIP